MSYILDALRRAEQERQRGSAPGLHTPAATPPAAATAPSPLAMLPWLVAAGALLLGVLLGYWWLRPAVTANPLPPAALPAAAPPSLPAPAAPRVIAASPPATAPVTAPPPRTHNAEAELPLLSQLAPAERQSLPPLAIGGYIYAEKPAERSVILNQRLLHEGEQIAPGLTLERMTPVGMILDWRGRRFRLAYN